ncbi:uncharacterized protein K444DRAFT_139542 [Hyaloscypha bicolor E]|uniref:Uncharacterized protein n=1 Tax=Hyaloscypha bicolor E TaxID=1095630 RepID=A0A2J6SU14_9HELO|nr:uncharacterized protein K444DRAFT_139542 [Hyaloscypha bicolor E]PMD54264.1 hypothetical protein K444DRAFT_139542 [Hyaloscypha bicolor E]
MRWPWFGTKRPQSLPFSSPARTVPNRAPEASETMSSLTPSDVDISHPRALPLLLLPLLFIFLRSATSFGRLGLSRSKNASLTPGFPLHSF